MTATEVPWSDVSTKMVRSWYRGVAERDWDYLRSIVDPEIIFVVADGFPSGGAYRGRQAVFDEFFSSSFAAWDWMRPEIETMLPADEGAVVVIGNYVGVTADTKTPFTVPFAHIWWVGSAGLRALRQYSDTAIMRDRIAGISE